MGVAGEEPIIYTRGRKVVVRIFTNRDQQIFKFRALMFLFFVSTSCVSFLNFTDCTKICSYRLESSTFSTSVADPDPGSGSFFGSGMENNPDSG